MLKTIFWSQRFPDKYIFLIIITKQAIQLFNSSAQLLEAIMWIDLSCWSTFSQVFTVDDNPIIEYKELATVYVLEQTSEGY